MPDIEALIRERAYLIWEKSGKPFGRDTDHWFQAAEEIAAESALEPTTLKATPTTGTERKRGTREQTARRSGW